MVNLYGNITPPQDPVAPDLNFIFNMAHTRSGQIQSSFSGHPNRKPEKRTRMAGEQLGLSLEETRPSVFRGFRLSGDYTPLVPIAPPGTIDIGAAEQTLL
jgi:hypothetical protein